MARAVRKTVDGEASEPARGAAPEGHVWMRVSSWGHMEISNGLNEGFGRMSAGEEFLALDASARSLYEKRQAEPLDAADADRWTAARKAEEARAAEAMERVRWRQEGA